MNWRPFSPKRAPHTGWLWTAIGIGLIVAGFQFMHDRPHRVVSARQKPDTPPPPPAATNTVPLSSVSPEEAHRIAATLADLFGGSTQAPSGDVWDLIQRLQDPGATPEARRMAARELALQDDPLALAFLSESARNGPPRLRALIAEALGTSPLPEARDILLPLLNDPDPAVGRGALRGLAAAPSAETALLLGGMLNDARRPESIRSEAALILGTLPDPAASCVLIEALREAASESLRAQLWDAIGMRPILETGDFVREMVQSPVPNDLQRLAAIESLSGSAEDVSSLLTPILRDGDPEVREAAAWSLSVNEHAVSAAPWVLDALMNESDPGVRLRLYDALGNQQSMDAPRLMALVEGEAHPRVRLAGLQALAMTLQRGGAPERSAWFDSTAVPFLQQEALATSDLLHRMTAVTTLARVGSPAALDALQVIAQQSDDPRLAQAATMP